jgi:hypothetical protein
MLKKEQSYTSTPPLGMAHSRAKFTFYLIYLLNLPEGKIIKRASKKSI